MYVKPISSEPSTQAMEVAMLKRRLLYASTQIFKPTTVVASPGPPNVSRKIFPMFWNVPINAPTKLMKNLEYGKGYQKYDKESYLPEKLKGKKYLK